MTGLAAARYRVVPADTAPLVLVAGALACWAAVTVALALGYLVPPHYSVAWLLFAYVAPLGATAFVIVGPPRVRALAPVAGAMVVVATALIVARHVPTWSWVPAAAAPALAATAIAVRRWPAAAIITVVALTGAQGSIVAFTPISPRPIADLVLGAAWLGLLGGVLVGRRSRPAVIWPGVVLALAFIALTLAAIPLSPAVDPALRAFRISVWYFLAFVLVAYAGWKRPTHDQIARAIVFIALAVGAYATLRWAIGPDAKESAIIAEAGGDAEYNTIAPGQEKVQGSLPDGVSLGTWTTTMIPFCLAIALAWRGRIRLVALAAIPLLVIALFGSQLRAGVVATAAGVAVVMILHQLTRGIHRSKLLVVVVAVLGLGAAAVAVYPAVVDTPEKSARYRNILTPSRDTSFQERLHKWRNALDDIKDHPLGQGLGTGGTEARATQRFPGKGTNAVDSSYLRIAYDQGMAVMILLVGTLLTLIGGLARRAVWTRSPRRAVLAIGAAGTLTAYMGLMGTTFVFDHFSSLATWVIVGLGVARFSIVEDD